MSEVFGAHVTGARQESPFGSLGPGLANLLSREQGKPLLTGLGFGGDRRFQRFEDQLGTARGPLADFIRSVQGFAPGVGPEAQQVGAETAARGSAAFETLTGQINQALSSLPQFQEAGRQGTQYAEQFARDAFSPQAETPLFRESSRRLLSSLRPGLAARGILESGPGAQSESDALRDLTLGFADRERGNQLAAVQALPLAAEQGAALSGAGIPIAQAGLGAVPQLTSALASRYQQPLQALGALFQLLSGGAQPASQLLQQTAPQFVPFSGKQSPFGVGVSGST